MIGGDSIMADEPESNTPLRTEDDSDSSSEEEAPAQWLATNREKRSTAGNRLSTLLQQEAEDDELELLFAEDEDDEGFEIADDDSDVQMDSSDDDEDQGPTADAEDLEGERELQKAVKADRAAKKRKTNDLPPAFRKRVKIAAKAGSETSTTPRPKKKSERASWIPTADDAPVRASARGTTKKSKEHLYAQMIDRERRRLKQLENMEKAAKKKEAEKQPELTQEDRLAEAARVEKKNAKSLNRWEEAEKLREEEQKAKLAALNNRRLEGPVITLWSGKAEWVGGVLKQVGKNLILEDPKEKSKRKKIVELDSIEITTPAQKPAIPTTPATAVPATPVTTLPATPGTVVPTRPTSNDGSSRPATASTVAPTATTLPPASSASSQVLVTPTTTIQTAPNTTSQASSTSVIFPQSAPNETSQTSVTPSAAPSAAPSVAPSAAPLTEPNAPPQVSKLPQVLPAADNTSQVTAASKAEESKPAPPAPATIAKPEPTPTSEPVTVPKPEPVMTPATPTIPTASASTPTPASTPAVAANTYTPAASVTTPKPVLPVVPVNSIPAPATKPFTPAMGTSIYATAANSLPHSSTPISNQPLIRASPLPQNRPMTPSFRPPTSIYNIPHTANGYPLANGSAPRPYTPYGPPPAARTPALALDGSAPLPGFLDGIQYPANLPSQPPRMVPSPTTPFAFTPAPQPPSIEHSTRNLVILENFDEGAIKDKQVQAKILTGKKFVKMAKIHPEVCAITGVPAKYRDPATGLAYCNAHAYKEIQKLKRGEYKWSGLLGAYVGLGQKAARGVPERFA